MLGVEKDSYRLQAIENIDWPLFRNEMMSDITQISSNLFLYPSRVVGQSWSYVRTCKEFRKE